MLADNEWVLHGGGVDYITLTGRPGRPAQALGELAKAHRGMMERDGFHVKPCNALGYKGERYGNWFFGERQDGVMLRVSGADSMGVVGALSGVSLNCSRIDCHATLKCIPGDRLWAVRAASLAQSQRAAAPGCNWAGLKLLETFGRGDTLTVGSRTSEKYGRLYDKEMESLDPSYEGCWRYEVEYKGDHARAAFERLRVAPSIPRAAAELAAQQWRAWCVPFPDVAIVSAEPLYIPREKPDVEKKGEWLMEQVLPTLAWLVDNGYEHVVDKLFKHAYTLGGER